MKREQTQLTKKLSDRRLDRENKIWESALRSLPKKKSIFMKQEHLDDDPLQAKSSIHSLNKSATIDLWQNNRPAKIQA
jgi:hypothetical protein